jgi:DNA-binding response OmpR family regulator
MIDDMLALVIEDDFDASVIFAKALEVLGFKTEVIMSGSEALERLKVVVPEIIVLDLHLPGILGTNILRDLRADERLKETLVIVATADPRSADLIQDLADLVLIKPTTFSQVRDLASRLTSFRRKKRAAAEAAKKEEINAPAAEETKAKAEPVSELPTEETKAKAEPVSKLPTEKAETAAEEEKTSEAPNLSPTTEPGKS